jgi:cyclopropane-fatty-acyl-phospholipid synthase
MKQTIERLLNSAGIEINGSRPWDIQVHDDQLFSRILAEPSLGAGESYMDGWWDCEQIDEMFSRLLSSNIDQQVKRSPREMTILLLSRLFNRQSKSRSKQVAERHYDLGNSFYEQMLGPTMNYSCGYWKDASTLDEAERNKMELICRKLMLKPGLKLLDIGCGWGSLARYAAENYGVEVVGITISARQKEYAEKLCKGFSVKILGQDYRDLPKDPFDRIVSVGMFEHVGYKNYAEFMQIARDRLKDDGIFLLHTIGANATSHYGDPWINKYIFPNGMLPSIVQISEAMESRFVMEDWHNFGADYDRTLMAWHHNFNQNWPAVKHQYDERFRRMWNYYLLSCAGGFRARRLELWQIVMTKYGLRGGFHQRDLSKGYVFEHSFSN